MNADIVLPAALIALAYVMWPIVGKYSGIAGGWVGILASFGTFSIVATASLRGLKTVPAMRSITLLLLAGAINGIRVYFYSMKTSDPSIPTGIFIVTTCMMMVAWAPILDFTLNGSIPHARQIAGFGTALLAIYLIGK